MTDWVGAQGQVNLAKKTQTTCDDTPRNPQIQNENFFLICGLRLAESVEGLNSSLAQSPGELLSCQLFKNCKNWLTRDLKGTTSQQSAAPSPSDIY